MLPAMSKSYAVMYKSFCGVWKSLPAVMVNMPSPLPSAYIELYMSASISLSGFDCASYDDTSAAVIVGAVVGVIEEIESTVGIDCSDCIVASAKSGIGIEVCAAAELF